MASKTVDPIDWPLPPTLRMSVPPELHVLHGTNAEDKSRDVVQPLGREHVTIGMPRQRIACAVTQGMNACAYRNPRVATSRTEDKFHN